MTPRVYVPAHSYVTSAHPLGFRLQSTFAFKTALISPCLLFLGYVLTALVKIKMCETDTKIMIFLAQR